MEFKKYIHIERLGTDETLGILEGTVHVFPKLDGMNVQLWRDKDTVLRCGTRNNELTEANIKDGKGFMQYVYSTAKYDLFFEKYPDVLLYGEWLTGGTIKYKQEHLRKFYVFDVLKGTEFIPYDEYRDMLKEFDLVYIPRISQLVNTKFESIVRIAENDFYLTESIAQCSSEGVVIKNYKFVNKFNRVTWGKYVNERVPTKLKLESENDPMFEVFLVNKYCTMHLVQKVYNKIKLTVGGWKSVYIPRLLETVYHDLINEEIWSMLKEQRGCTIDFGVLRKITVNKIKQLLPNLF